MTLNLFEAPQSMWKIPFDTYRALGCILENKVFLATLRGILNALEAKCVNIPFVATNPLDKTECLQSLRKWHSSLAQTFSLLHTDPWEGHV